jgi:hypothetical protein
MAAIDFASPDELEETGFESRTGMADADFASTEPLEEPGTESHPELAGAETKIKQEKIEN